MLLSIINNQRGLFPLILLGAILIILRAINYASKEEVAKGVCNLLTIVFAILTFVYILFDNS